MPNGGSATFNKYYYFGSQRVAAKIAGTLFYLQGDHLGSSSVVMTQAGTSFYSRQTYYPYGTQRTTEGSALPTDYTFTGQKNDDSTGLMFYGARYYDTTLGRFISADTIVPSPLNPQSLNRFSYVLNNPVRYIDPTGHIPCEDPDDRNPGQGGDDQPTGEIPDPNVTQPGGGEPQAQPGYCDQNPYANGCVDLPVSDDSSSDDCNIANCDKPEEYSQDNPPPQLYCKTIHWSGLCDELYGGNDRWAFTLSVGGTGSYCWFGGCGTGDIGTTIDDSGNWVPLYISPGGYGSPSGGLVGGWFVQVTNALNIFDLQGRGAFAGGSYTPAGHGLGLDVVRGPNGDNNYWGLKLADLYGNTEYPIRLLPGEVHVGGSTTIFLMQPIDFRAVISEAFGGIYH